MTFSYLKTRKSGNLQEKSTKKQKVGFIPIVERIKVVQVLLFWFEVLDNRLWLLLMADLHVNKSDEWKRRRRKNLRKTFFFSERRVNGEARAVVRTANGGGKETWRKGWKLALAIHQFNLVYSNFQSVFGESLSIIWLICFWRDYSGILKELYLAH